MPDEMDGRGANGSSAEDGSASAEALQSGGRPACSAGWQLRSGPHMMLCLCMHACTGDVQCMIKAQRPEACMSVGP